MNVKMNVKMTVKMNVKMKNIYLACIGAAACALCSCSGMLDSIRPYLDEGETIYAGRMDYVLSFTGKNRARVLGLRVYGVNQNRCAISWTNPVSLTKETREFTVDPAMHQDQFPVDSLLQLDSLLLDPAASASMLDTLLQRGYVFDLDNLEEGQHDFSIVLLDPQGNRSIPTVASTYVYGQAYEDALINRSFKAIGAVQLPEGGQAVRIRWFVSRETSLVGCNLEYDRLAGDTARLFVAVGDTATNLTDYMPGGKWRYTTIYRPSVFSLDAFYARVEELTLPAPAGF